VRDRALYILVLAILVGSASHALFGYTHLDHSGHALGTDDAYISYRYARNLTRGLGLVYNPGERVEGYSNLLYALLMAPACWLTDGLGVYGFSTVWNALLLALALVAFHRHLERSLGRDAAKGGALLVALYPVFWVWAASGLETTLVLFLQITIWSSVEDLRSGRDRRASYVIYLAGAALALVRADGFVFPALAAAFLWWQQERQVAARYTLAVGATVLGNVGWRLAYYGAPLPNSYYVKVDGPLPSRLEHAGRQLWSDSLVNGMMPYLLILLASALILLLGRARRDQFLPGPFPSEVALAFGMLIYWLYVGGDVFGERFLLILPPLALSLLLRGRGWLAARRGFLLAALLAVQASVFLRDGRFSYTLGKYDRWVALGKFLGERYPGKLLAVDAAGKIPFFSGLVTIDMLGLNDRFIAHKESGFWLAGHNKFDAAYVLSRRPEVIAGGVFENLDMDWGLSRRIYQEQGYELRYLVNSEKDSSRKRPFPLDDIVDVSGMSEEQVSTLIRTGHRYGVLIRAEQAPDLPR